MSDCCGRSRLALPLILALLGEESCGLSLFLLLPLEQSRPFVISRLLPDEAGKGAVVVGGQFRISCRPVGHRLPPVGAPGIFIGAPANRSGSGLSGGRP
jgi:hypothetical protein